ncbi:helicase C-terminal domain-containing protein [Lacticaseibacillus daqingensis]|uniref:helicase C-terminal domain-containing protein n=1 Tax=Lacticaseibacillus daqingensis TaxID=2486014 RepID=UPI000F76FFD5|nr:helicase C-terminal domain-containing protein [Lacticaseibacillus daqingensis]
MTSATTYAVIDLETTGTSVDAGDRIIQFGCALMRDGQILTTVSQLVNPDQPVPPAIQTLTGIASGDLVAAPYFEDIGYMVEDLLADTVVVAHNVNFDYPFLSAELTRIGLRPLVNPAIDTVELAQILLPTQASFRLSDLTEALHIPHADPHHADSDALATAKLLWQLQARLQALPAHTQQQLAAMGSALTRQTGDWLRQHAVVTQPLAEGLQQVGAFCLRRPTPLTTTLHGPGAYPLTDKAKKRLLTPTYKLRRAQAKMMDAVYANATGAQLPLMIEAGTGLGKTFGYLLPYAYVCDENQKLVVATATTVLQEQLVTGALPALEALLGRPLPTVRLKSARHYLDLGKFAAELRDPAPNRLTRLLQLRLLVWLTQTTTGDLDELHLTNYKAPLFARVRHTPGQPATGPYAASDFYQRLLTQVKDATVVVTNHAYLARHFADLQLSQPPFLVVDEAQHFADNAAPAFSHRIDLRGLRLALSHLKELINRTSARSLSQIYADNGLVQYQLSSTTTTLDALITRISALQATLYAHLFHGELPTGHVEKMLMPEQVDWLLTAVEAPLTMMTARLDALAAVFDTLTADFAAHADRFLVGDAAVFDAVSSTMSGLNARRAALAALDPTAMRQGAGGVTCATLTQGHDVTSLAITWDRFDVAQPLQAALAHFLAPLFVGATLTVDRSFDFLARQLGYAPLPEPQTLRLRSPFHYKQQAAVFLAEDAPNANDLTETEYADYLATTIAALADNDHQTIALFTSLRTIQAVYARLVNSPLSQRKELLAQGVTGSAEKIAKRFALADNALLLGAASFFEGIDYPAKQLEQVILTRLPFDAPDEPVTKARYIALRQAGQDAFKVDALPRATLRFRQSFGRLIRTEHDRGVFVCLDPRLTRTPFGRKMAKSLPNLKPVTLPLAELQPLALAWLEGHDIRKEGTHA